MSDWTPTTPMEVGDHFTLNGETQVVTATLTERLDMTTTAETAWVFAALHELYTEHNRWPTVQEFAAHVDIPVTAELQIELETMRMSVAELVDKIENRRADERVPPENSAYRS